MIENQSLLTRPDSKIEDISYILKSLPDLKFVLDTGNFFCVGEDVVKAYEILREKIVHVHVKDWRINPCGAMMRANLPRFEGCAIGDGLLPNLDIIKMLKRDNYSGSLVLEMNACKINLEILDRSADFLLNTCK